MINFVTKKNNTRVKNTIELNVVYFWYYCLVRLNIVILFLYNSHMLSFQFIVLKEHLFNPNMYLEILFMK